jgi:hypothetical protein
MQNNKEIAKPSVNIVQDDTKIVQIMARWAFLDDSTQEFGRYYLSVPQIFFIFAAEIEDANKNEQKTKSVIMQSL